jgi:hypothetical protein
VADEVYGAHGCSSKAGRPGYIALPLRVQVSNLYYKCAPQV